MRNHLARCKENPNREAFKRQKILSSTTEVSVSSSPTISKFDQNTSRMKLVKMFVKSELPFRFVENEDLHDFEVFGIGIRQYSESGDVSIKLMAMRLKGKYEKYWGNNGINILLLIVVVLDPRMLVCTQDWLKGTPFPILFDEDPKELDKFEQVITSQDEVGPSSAAINFDD
ncbi:hypothetical protein V8G54_008060 [Vigna mungo]|uniref:hAT-like transposase RNase-H fold domain-containing protein n=1 Tax=Vigna mungo TaxID=3915 RepID=A0AAQ3P6I6_VIGMU